MTLTHKIEIMKDIIANTLMMNKKDSEEFKMLAQNKIFIPKYSDNFFSQIKEKIWQSKGHSFLS